MRFRRCLCVNDCFFYEHLGHMQISVLTLDLYKILFELSSAAKEVPIRVDDISNKLRLRGYHEKAILSEIERFFYGYECFEEYIEGIRYMSITPLGSYYINEIKHSIKSQRNQLAIIIRNSRRKDYVNVIVQESTFFDSNLYYLLEKYKFRTGGARDFLKCIKISELIDFLTEAIDNLNEDGNTYKDGKLPQIEECISIIEKNGKYWNGVGSKYSWLFFKQKYELDFMEKEWKDYATIMQYMKHPVEWGGNAKDASLEDLRNIDRDFIIEPFLNYGILRRLYSEKQELKYRLTAPGFLMWERKNRGFLLEILITRQSATTYSVDFCHASDITDYYIYSNELIDYIEDNGQNTIKTLKEELFKYKNRGNGLFYE